MPIPIEDKPRETLDLSQLAVRPTRIAVTPFPTLFWALDMTGVASRESEPWVRAARSALDPHDFDVLMPVLTRPHGFVPDSLAWIPDRAPRTPAEELDRIGDTTPEQLLADFGSIESPGIVGPWRPALRQPRLWLRRYAKALRKVWAGLEPSWKAAAPAIEREVERAGSAIARGAVPELIASVHPVGAVRDNVLSLPSPHAAELKLLEGGLVLMPKLAGHPARTIKVFEGAALTHLDYLLPGLARVLADRPAVPSSLEALVGRPRARILQHLDRPQTVGQIAELLLAVPSAASHHADALEAAGLVARERQGRHVMVKRTARGTALLALYDVA